jgi:RNA polymerase sigma-70 factor (ECF subfamily)
MSSEREQDEIRLVERCASASEEAYAELVARFETPLMNYIARFVGNRTAAEDLFQETFVRVVSSIRRFDPRCRLSTWLFTIAHNLCIDFLRRTSRLRHVSVGRDEDDNSSARRVALAQILPDGRASAPEAAQKTEERELVLSCLRELAPAKREALILRIYEGLSYEEIADVTNSHVGTVKFRVHDAIRDLARKMGKAGGHAGERQAI